MPPFPDWVLPFVTRDMLDGHESNTYAIKVHAWSNQSANMRIRALTKSGWFSQIFNHSGGGADEKTTFNVSELPFCLSISAPGFSPQSDWAYIKVVLTINGDEVYELVNGYISSGQTLSWPQDPLRHQLDTGNPMMFGAAADPAANVEVSDAVPTGELWKPQVLLFKLVTDGTAANRHVVFSITNGGANVWTMGAPAVQTASTTVSYCLHPGASWSNDSTGLIQTIPIPADLVIGSSTTIKTTTANRQVGDNWARPSYAVTLYSEAIPA